MSRQLIADHGRGFAEKSLPQMIQIEIIPYYHDPHWVR